MINSYKLRTVQKTRNLYGQYRPYLYNTIAELSCEICEVPAPADNFESLAEIRTAIPQRGWHSVSNGDRWGGDYCYAYFRSEYTVPESMEGKALLIRPDFGAPETLLILNGKPSGLFDVCDGVGGERLHETQPLTFSAKTKEHFTILFESYAGHPLSGCMVYESEGYIEGRMYPRDTVRTYSGLKIVACDDDIAAFLMQHRTVSQMIDVLPQDSCLYAEAVNAMCEIFPLLPQRPTESSEDWRSGLRKAVEILKSVTGKKTADGENLGYVGLTGHSHLDTAWLWPVRETVHKAARTFSNALRLMEHYPEYRFMQSSVLYLDWMKKYYPSIFEDIKKRIAEGRWEPNGGTWIECDDNIPSGEYMIRQFVRGQRYTKENFNYMADCFWQPDTFGYSAALPQILKGCGIRYFLTTKLSWNEANKFPHDTFMWRGIDGSRVLTHFNLMHAWPDVQNVRETAISSIQNKDVTNMKLLAYGFGDGGGGPSYSMLESEKIIRNMAGMPDMEDTSVSAFMNRLEKTAKNIPVFSGELYLELHRGTLTQMHEIKRSNRMLEHSIHNFEIINILSGEKKNQLIDSALDTLLLNQFHDILPGTCLASVEDIAVHQNYSAAEKLDREVARIMSGDGDQGFVLCNTLSWERKGQITVPDNGFVPDGCIVQHYSDLDGEKKLSIGGVETKALSLHFVPFGSEKKADCPFMVNGKSIKTPFADIIFRNGQILSYRTKDGFEAVRNPEKPLNILYCGEDIPFLWDNWDVDYDQKEKMHPTGETLSSEVVSCGALQLRIRTVRQITEKSTLSQDVVFYADTPRIDFESVIDWNDKHMLLKAGFDVNVQSDTARFETQFGNVKRPTHENYCTDQSQFEVCNHKWTDLSDNRFGVAILNDCKYGISVSDSDMQLTLHKGGCHPDTRGDCGKHKFTYSLLIHESGFSTESVIRPAYELNYPTYAMVGGEKSGTDNRELFTVDAHNIIIETVKFAEDGNGIAVRLYETEGSHAVCYLKSGFNADSILETDMLEYAEKRLDVQSNTVKLVFHPFEIKTILYKQSDIF